MKLDGTTTAMAGARMTAHLADVGMHRPTAMLRRSRRAAGFTLVELMAAVAIVGILAALAVVGYRRYINTAQTGEALGVISGIRNAEESYKAETLTYLGCSGCGGTGCAAGAGSLTNYYPMAAPNSHKYSWQNSGHADYQCWRTLNIVTDGPVRFGYAVVAGNPGQALPALSRFNPVPTWPATANQNPWFVVQAAGDRDDNTKFAYFASSSLSGEIIRQDESE